MKFLYGVSEKHRQALWLFLFTSRSAYFLEVENWTVLSKKSKDMIILYLQLRLIEVDPVMKIDIYQQRYINFLNDFGLSRVRQYQFKFNINIFELVLQRIHYFLPLLIDKLSIHHLCSERNFTWTRINCSIPVAMHRKLMMMTLGSSSSHSKVIRDTVDHDVLYERKNSSCMGCLGSDQSNDQ